MPEIKSITYEESRLEYFRRQKAHAERCLEYWVKAMIKGKTGYTQIDIEDKCSEYGAIINYYEDAINALEGKKMSDLVSREALFRAWDALDETQDPNLLIDAMIRKTQNAPGVDAEPVRHGEWVKVYPYDGDSPVRCTYCKETFDYIDGVCYLMHNKELPNYCPNCGAKMMENRDV